MMNALQCVCVFPGCLVPAYRSRQRTAYNDEESNYMTACMDHQKEADEYWLERWADYYRGIM